MVAPRASGADAGRGQRADPRGHGEAIEAFEREWFPIVRLAFQRKRPELVTRLLGRLRLEGKREAIYLVPPFLLALRQLEASEIEQDRESFAHLQARGLTEEVIRAGEAHVRGFVQLDGPIPYGSLLAIEEQAVAEL